LIKGFSPVFLVSLRFFVGGIFFVFFVKFPRKELLQLFLLSFTLHAIPLSLTAISIQYIDAALASLTTQLDVPFAWILSVIFLKEKISSMQIFGLLLSFVGMYLVADSPEFLGQTYPLLALIVASFMYGVASIQVKKMTLSPGTMTAWSYVISAPFTLVMSLLLEGKTTYTNIDHSIAVWFWFFALTFLSLFAFYIWSQLLQKVEVSQVVSFTILIPLSSLGFSYMLLGETTHQQALLGGILTMLGVAVQVGVFRKFTQTSG